MEGILSRFGRGAAIGLFMAGVLLLTWTSVHAQATDPAVKVGKTAALGDVLVGPNGMTLYVFTKDTAGVSNCSGNCLKNWPALTVPAGATPTAATGLTLKLGTIKRTDDGTTQVTLDGMPLYYWAADKVPGDATGHGVQGVWFALNSKGAQLPVPEPAVKVGKTTALGDVLVGPKGMTLYIFTRDTPGVTNCTGNCLKNWPALTVEAGQTPAAATGLSLKLGTIKRADDGTTQVTLDGYPLYYWAADKVPGDTSGHGVQSVWFAVDSKGAWLAAPAAAASPTAAATPAAPRAGNGTVATSGPDAMNAVTLAGVGLALAGAVTLGLARRREDGNTRCNSSHVPDQSDR